MLDVIFVGLTLVLFGLMAAYAFGCDKLWENHHDRTDRGTGRGARPRLVFALRPAASRKIL